jgi:tRNA(Ile)-lysidine synthase
MVPLASSNSESPTRVPDGERPVGDAEFAHLIDRVGPFERAPHIAVGVSGGADSLALALLADRWARRRGGRLTAVIVDHRLRTGSSDEVASVARWLEARGIAAVVRAWEGPKPASAIQAAAREARHAILAGWCREAAVLHLLLAHHRDDQIETMLLRRARNSGPDGLAGMAAVVERDGLRVLRPLLPVAAARLRATLQAAGQDWVDDPSNRNPAFARIRVRAGLAQAPATEIEGHGRAMADLAQARVGVEGDIAGIVGGSVAVYPEGWARLDPGAWGEIPRQHARRILARLAMTIGGAKYAPRGERLERLLEAVLASTLAGGRTLGGCRFIPQRSKILVVREAASAGQRIAIDGPGIYVWDSRFAVTVTGRGPWLPGRHILARLGAEGWRQIAAAAPELRRLPIPAAVRPALPTLFDLEGVRAVPHLMYGRRGADPDSVTIVSMTFRPRHALAGSGFAVN